MDDQCVVLIQSPLELVCDIVISAAIIAVYVPQLRYPSLKNIEGSASNVTATLLHALFATDQLSNALIAHWFVLPCVTSGLVKGINAVRLFLGLAQATIIFICAAHLFFRTLGHTRSRRSIHILTFAVFTTLVLLDIGSCVPFYLVPKLDGSNSSRWLPVPWPLLNISLCFLLVKALVLYPIFAILALLQMGPLALFEHYRSTKREGAVNGLVWERPMTRSVGGRSVSEQRWLCYPEGKVLLRKRSMDGNFNAGSMALLFASLAISALVSSKRNFYKIPDYVNYVALDYALAFVSFAGLWLVRRWKARRRKMLRRTDAEEDERMPLLS